MNKQSLGEGGSDLFWSARQKKESTAPLCGRRELGRSFAAGTVSATGGGGGVKEAARRSVCGERKGGEML